MATERISQLCDKLARDATLLEVLTHGGISDDEWNALYQAIIAGADPVTVTHLLDRVDQVADSIGLDPVTSTTREFLPITTGSPGYRSVEAWRCPHRRSCGRSQIGQSAMPKCGLTGDLMEQVRVVSG